MTPTRILLLLSTLLLMVRAAHAGEPVALLVEEREDGQPGETILIEGERHAPANEVEAKAAEENFWETLEITSAVTVTAPLPYSAIGGQVGVTLPSQIIEVGGELDIFVIPPGNSGPNGASGGFSIGAYLQLAPIPGEWGHRFYILGRVFRAFALGKPAFDAFGFGAGIGYRQPLDEEREKYVFVELTLERDHLYTYDDVLVMPRLSAGVRF